MADINVDVLVARAMEAEEPNYFTCAVIAMGTRIRELESASQPGGGWQPIETAPKDGTRIILWWGDLSVFGWWLDNTNTRTPWAGWRAPSLVTVPYGCKPTHWMPMPTGPRAAPSAGNGGAED